MLGSIVRARQVRSSLVTFCRVTAGFDSRGMSCIVASCLGSLRLGEAVEVRSVAAATVCYVLFSSVSASHVEARQLR